MTDLSRDRLAPIPGGAALAAGVLAVVFGAIALVWRGSITEQSVIPLVAAGLGLAGGLAVIAVWVLVQRGMLRPGPSATAAALTFAAVLSLIALVVVFINIQEAGFPLRRLDAHGATIFGAGSLTLAFVGLVAIRIGLAEGGFAAGFPARAAVAAGVVGVIGAAATVVGANAYSVPLKPDVAELTGDRPAMPATLGDVAWTIEAPDYVSGIRAAGPAFITYGAKRVDSYDGPTGKRRWALDLSSLRDGSVQGASVDGDIAHVATESTLLDVAVGDGTVRTRRTDSENRRATGTTLPSGSHVDTDGTTVTISREGQKPDVFVLPTANSDTTVTIYGDGPDGSVVIGSSHDPRLFVRYPGRTSTIDIDSLPLNAIDRITYLSADGLSPGVAATSDRLLLATAGSIVSVDPTSGKVTDIKDVSDTDDIRWLRSVPGAVVAYVGNRIVGLTPDGR
ncbi:MAG: hypothetical protein QM774_05030 [Gordonia sp. (in: high G+C Gram-positive bacteria)]|uniref:hypothetical protein n=1 Tax=Gordonia sp. (in: high G+C Gram-positive bacteria) TaxID=84139 RepID=UPI0039E4A63C